MKRNTITFTLPKGCSVRSVTLRELNGEDEEDAIARMADPKTGNIRTKGGVAMTTLRGELVAASIVQVEGEDVIAPFHGWSKWNLRTRDLVSRVFDRMNGVSEKEVEDFDKAVFGAASEPGDTDSSPSGSGSPGT